MKIAFRVTSSGLVPLCDSDWEEYRNLKLGSDVIVDPKKERNILFHRKFFALLRLTFDNFPEILQNELQVYSVDDLLSRLKIDLGLFRIVRYGSMQAISPNSISFEKMDEYEFKTFYNKCVNHILNHYLKGVAPSEVEEEIWRYL